jgi:cell division protease FtsH
VNEAALIATRRSAQKVEEQDLTAGIERIVGGLERKSRVLSSEEKRRVAYHEMGHATVSMALGQGELVHKVSIVSRGIGALGYTMRRPTEDRYLMSRSGLESQMAVMLGGRASEFLFFKEVSTGAADDLDHATDISRSMVTRYGMSARLGLLTYDRESSPFLEQRILPRSHDYSEETAKIIDQETMALVDQAFDEALKVVRQYRGFVEAGVGLLLEKETIDEDTLSGLWRKWSAPVYPLQKRA